MDVRHKFRLIHGHFKTHLLGNYWYHIFTDLQFLLAELSGASTLDEPSTNGAVLFVVVRGVKCERTWASNDHCPRTQLSAGSRLVANMDEASDKTMHHYSYCFYDPHVLGTITLDYFNTNDHARPRFQDVWLKRIIMSLNTSTSALRVWCECLCVCKNGQLAEHSRERAELVPNRIRFRLVSVDAP